MDYEFSKHATDQMLVRSISIQQVEEVLDNPQQIIREVDYTIYQSIIKFGERNYLLRVFLNDKLSPNKVITVYTTSKIDKYHEGEI